MVRKEWDREKGRKGEGGGKAGEVDPKGPSAGREGPLPHHWPLHSQEIGGDTDPICWPDTCWRVAKRGSKAATHCHLTPKAGLPRGWGLWHL